MPRFADTERLPRGALRGVRRCESDRYATTLSLIRNEASRRENPAVFARRGGASRGTEFSTWTLVNGFKRRKGASAGKPGLMNGLNSFNIAYCWTDGQTEIPRGSLGHVRQLIRGTTWARARVCARVCARTSTRLVSAES